MTTSEKDMRIVMQNERERHAEIQRRRNENSTGSCQLVRIIKLHINTPNKYVMNHLNKYAGNGEHVKSLGEFMTQRSLVVKSPEISAIYGEIVRCLTALRVTHGDLHPWNIYLRVGADGQWREIILIDFGKSKVHNMQSSIDKFRLEQAQYARDKKRNDPLHNMSTVHEIIPDYHLPWVVNGLRSGKYSVNQTTTKPRLYDTNLFIKRGYRAVPLRPYSPEDQWLSNGIRQGRYAVNQKTGKVIDENVRWKTSIKGVGIKATPIRHPAPELLPSSRSRMSDKYIRNKFNNLNRRNEKPKKNNRRTWLNRLSRKRS